MLKKDKTNVLLLAIYQNRYGERENRKWSMYRVSAYNCGFCTEPFSTIVVIISVFKL